MDIDDLHPLDDYSHRFFIWHEWIQANGPLTTDNVFDYFATSMFYDKQSNNQVLRMQTIHTGQPILNEADELKRFTGIEFAVVHAQPPSLFIIQKRERLSPEEGNLLSSYDLWFEYSLALTVRPLAAYFIMNNRIYQSPDIYTVLSNRLLTSLHSLQSSLDTLRAHRPDFTPRSGFAWPIMEPPSPGSANEKLATGMDLDDSQHHTQAPGLKSDLQSIKKQQNLIPLFNAMRTTAAHSNKTFALRASEIMGPADAAPTLSSATPVPTRDGTPKTTVHTPSIEPSVKAPTGAGKKKKKRRSKLTSSISMNLAANHRRHVQRTTRKLTTGMTKCNSALLHYCV
ncbi:MED6-domain-containing protein [Rickenella mellea]|uniref:Mediator of RNA polymerase II transcription subunit 6 n=1 Tax=Rickenella mellea TaxID=50990 RepID=A0A4Y7QNE5_9AGAM|nr:MED6-domain-containing protein [Rickenella mellea]